MGIAEPPRHVRNVSELERRLGRRVSYARPEALRSVELIWHTAWGDLLPSHLDDRYQLVRVDRSRSAGRCGNQDFQLTNGMVSVSTPGVTCTATRRASPYTQLRVALIPAPLMKLLAPERRTHARKRHFLVSPDAKLRSALDTLFDVVARRRSTLEQQTALLACASAAHEALVQAPDEAKLPHMPPRIRRVLSLLHDRFAEDLRLEDLHEAAGEDIHPRYLLTVFKKEVGMAPHQYLLRLRLRRAAELLARGMPASEVAPAVGFFDGSQLHVHFLRVLGTTPGAYARSVAPSSP